MALGTDRIGVQSLASLNFHRLFFEEERSVHKVQLFVSREGRECLLISLDRARVKVVPFVYESCFH